MPALLALALLLAAPVPPRPSAAALRRAFEAGERALVEVHGHGAGGPGVLVGAQGQVLTALRLVDSAGANVRLGSTVLGARLLLRSETLRVAILDVAGDGPFPAVAVRLETPEPGAWVVGIRVGRNGAAEPQLGRVIHGPGATGPWLSTSLSLPAGSPVLDGSGRLIAVVVEQRQGGSLAVPLQAVQAELRLLGAP